MKRKYYLLILSIFIFIMAFSTTGLAIEINDNSSFIKGITSYYNQNFDEAIVNLNKAIKNNNNEQIIVDSLYYQTLCYIGKNDIVKAKENILKLKKMGYEFGIIHWKLGEVYLNKHKQFDSPFYNEAKKELEKAYLLGINTTLFHRSLALVYKNLDELDKAEEEYEMIIAQNGQAEDYINLASIYKKLGKVNLAINTYEKALDMTESTQNRISIYSNLAELYMNDKDYEKAIKVLEESKKINPDFVAISTKLGEAYYLSGNYELAREEFEKVVSINDKSYKAYYYLGKIHEINHNEDKAIYYYKQALKYNPEYASAYIALGDIYIRQDKPYLAISHYSTAIEKNPNYPDSHFHLAVTYYILEMEDAAIAELKKTLHLNPNHRGAQKLLEKLTEGE
ncbi:tetratricopeptide repeat protein [Halothermothrix orenii]|uniref:TPR repeat-containing protein n=1 Tax=Halothermothrix orenii (strain H 168 / OCM 544 / DSM 9562) TaxID=373903 RepID=B8CXC2_HALOH|nr:tetratricopeptide repeat protein [Halothermothrix orenii]ACL69941.1 TPR repeat-containing protein [Halothermothrix orenii H 168]